MPIFWGLALLAAASPAEHLQDSARVRALLTIEDARPRVRTALAPLIESSTSTDTLVARWGARGLGRQQRADLITALQPALASRFVSVRVEAANAIGQSAVREGTAEARRLLEARLAAETEAVVRGAILRTLGRLPAATPAERARTEALLSTALAKDAPHPVAAGAAHGLASLYRRGGQQSFASGEAIERLVLQLAASRPALVRRIAMNALVASGRIPADVVLLAFADREREVRRLAALAAFAQPDFAGREDIIGKALADPDGAVRYEAVRAIGRHAPASTKCGRLLSALDDRDLHVKLLAVDLLGGCGAAATPRLVRLARGTVTGDQWHLPAHALLALARADSTAVTALLPAFVDSPIPWLRMYGARAAEAARITSILFQLARDSVAIVREAALGGLQRRVGHAADSLYLAALDSRDYMVQLTAAQALDSSTRPGVVEALGAAFARVTAERRETSRDPRIAMLESIEHIGSAPLVTQLRGAATDFDSTVAQTAARIATRGTADNIQAAPVPLPLAPVPSWADMAAWARLTAVFTMRSGGVVRVRLRPFDAPTNVARFVRMVRSGWFNGLTWHRVVPNFVVQGGSPGANEYMGDGPFTRDELGLEHHTRGTVGISTRGRDTGDGQLFFNTVDNWRLDHDYTIIGEVVEGMDVVDAWQEGAVIERVELRETP